MFKSAVFPPTWEWREITEQISSRTLDLKCTPTLKIRGVGAGREAQSSDDVSRLGSGAEFSPDVSDMRRGRVGMSLESSEDSDRTGCSADVSETGRWRGKGGEGIIKTWHRPGGRLTAPFDHVWALQAFGRV